MPIYEYECNDCGHQFEAIQKMSENALTDCPQCEKPALRKLISAVAFRLKGKGWYETDFKEGDKKNLSSTDSADSADKKADSNTNTGGSDKTDAKSDTQTANKDNGKNNASGSSDSTKKSKSETKSSTKKEKTKSSKTPENKKNK